MEAHMGWFGFGSGDKFEGDNDKPSSVQVNVKTESGKVTDVLVSESGKNPHGNHTHYYTKSNGGNGVSKKGKG